MVMLWALAPLIVHELGHWLAALLCGSRIHFTFRWGKLGPIPIPRGIWRWPPVGKKKLKIVCQAGFVVELGLIPFLPWPYAVVALMHFAAYPHYAGQSSDFKGMVEP